MFFVWLLSGLLFLVFFFSWLEWYILLIFFLSVFVGEGFVEDLRWEDGEDG